MTKRFPDPAIQSIHDNYINHTVRGYYEKHGDVYRNPHEPRVRAAIIEGMERLHRPPGRVLDLACGSGEATLALVELGWSVHGIDPYTGKIYRERTRLQPESVTFEQVAAGWISERRYDLIVCSYAMHLVDKSRLPILCFRLSEISPLLMVVSPHKRPEIKSGWGWQLNFGFIREKVHLKLYNKCL